MNEAKTASLDCVSLEIQSGYCTSETGVSRDIPITLVAPIAGVTLIILAVIVLKVMRK